MPTIIHNKTPALLTLLRPLLSHHHQIHPTTPRPPLVLALTAPQGAGKTTLSTHLLSALSPLRTAVLSIDDLYLPHSVRTSLSSQHSDNPFLTQRGAPGTHDAALGVEILSQFRDGEQRVRVPVYDKSAHSGKGDRGGWTEVEGEVDMVLLEGWCVGFTPLGEEGVRRVWKEDREAHGEQGPLGRWDVESLVWVDRQLERYEALWGFVDGMVVIDAESLDYVYEWRIEQEHGLIATKGTGMSDDQVRRFVDGYMPFYHLYLPGLRAGKWLDCLPKNKKTDMKNDEASEVTRQLRMVVGQDRNAVKVDLM